MLVLMRMTRSSMQGAANSTSSNGHIQFRSCQDGCCSCCCLEEGARNERNEHHTIEIGGQIIGKPGGRGKPPTGPAQGRALLAEISLSLASTAKKA